MSNGKKEEAVKSKKIILIVEDDEVLLRALYAFFHKSEYTIATANDGDTAVKMAQRLKPNIILLDLILPKMDGFRVLEILKAIPEFKKTPIIILSNLSDSADMAKAKALGAHSYFIKSNVNLAKIAETINEII